MMRGVMGADRIVGTIVHHLIMIGVVTVAAIIIVKLMMVVFVGRGWGEGTDWLVLLMGRSTTTGTTQARVIGTTRRYRRRS